MPWAGDKPLGLDMKGIEVVRRDWCGMVRQVCERSLELLLRPDRSIDVAVEYVRGIVSDLRQGSVDLRLLVISKQLGKKGEDDYVAKSAHVELAEKLRKRTPEAAPRPGDRVAYVVVAGAIGAKVYERAEDPQYAQAHGLPIDADYYVEQQLKQPLLRIFEPVVGGDPAKVASMLFAGGAGCKVTGSSGILAKGGLGAFVRRAEKCLACRTLLKGTEAFCESCSNTDLARAASEAKAAEGKACRERGASLRSACGRCVGLDAPGFEAEAEALSERCANVACEVFFERAAVARAETELRAAFGRLQLDW